MASYNLSDERREHMIRMILGEEVLERPDLDEPARLMYVVGGFVADDTGFVSQADLDEAWNNPSMRQAAKALLTEARSIPSGRGRVI
ncbi:hypothetical protein HZU40_11950 [Mycolicibacterium fluoranthenivorans]|uniref:Uncharacterized protein n=1 Tax=Mycolicibacterium fluoranthenivorans TaxID=258505 RepID=A0A7G8PKM1_9MYCO|nr:hypothetical protein [Mycolicibacterium fluoranthenivorans]QNJ94887.1 hypothetical protein HZU40_11950 [Mycolicibacterium fluoranthenivorans]